MLSDTPSYPQAFGLRKSSVLIIAFIVFPMCVATAAVDSLNRIFDFILPQDFPVIVVTDFTDVGRKLTPPTKTSPVYYEALILGYNDWGRVVAGEKIPEKKDMIKLIFKVLADQGYYPCDATHSPTIILALAWGSMNRKRGMSLLFMGGDKYDLMWEVDPIANAGAIDPHVLTLNSRNGDAALIMSMAGERLYVASIQAFDEAAALKDKTVLLWHTKITCPANGLAMDSALRRMVRTAAPLVGRETARPVVTVAPVRNATVEMGESRVLELIDLDHMPITDRTEKKPAEKSADKETPPSSSAAPEKTDKKP
jgi:hypothetical protein